MNCVYDEQKAHTLGSHADRNVSEAGKIMSYRQVGLIDLILFALFACLTSSTPAQVAAGTVMGSYCVYKGLHVVASGLNLTNEVFGFYNGSPIYPVQRRILSATASFGFRWQIASEQ